MECVEHNWSFQKNGTKIIQRNLVFSFFSALQYYHVVVVCVYHLFSRVQYSLIFFLLLLSALIVVILRAVFPILLFHNRVAVVSVVVKLSLPGNSR